MDQGIPGGTRTVTRRTKRRTGCLTCRVRKIKCDENKPFCQRCVSTGRNCDGYELLFRNYVTQFSKNGPGYGNQPGTGLQLVQPSLAEIGPREIDILNRDFTIKTMFGAELGCKKDARRILQASVYNPSIKYAVLSLRAFRKDFETSSLVGQGSSYNCGLQQYNTAIRGLASDLSSKGSNMPKLALLCCQLFISIEQVRGNYDVMAQHIFRGLRIMHEYRARPIVAAANEPLVVPARQDQLPSLDIFIIKLFAAPCKFAQPSARVNGSKPFCSDCAISAHQQLLAHDIRTELKDIASRILEFLDLVSNLEAEESTLQLRSCKEALLGSLQSWNISLELGKEKEGWSRSEPIPVSLMRLFHCILKVILLGSISSSADFDAQAQIENDRLQSVANDVAERLRACRMQVTI